MKFLNYSFQDVESTGDSSESDIIPMQESLSDNRSSACVAENQIPQSSIQCDEVQDMDRVKEV